MKLQKLVINGFGPYASRQELDFEKNLQGKNMFVITGNTGAGKTTIFDAINFALYGEASGSDREAKSLRSDFAEVQTPTEVELWFSLRGKEYYVKRTPSYLKPKLRGDGFVENKPTAEIKLSKDKTVTGVNQVTKEVEYILGITTEQFKQLVMIPQGEFKKLLNAKSEEKEDIFRKIFGTEIFQKIQNQIKEQANKLERGIREVQRDRSNKIKSFICKEKSEELFRIINAEEPNIEACMRRFQEFILEDNEEQKKLVLKVKGKGIVIEEISKEITLGEANNKKFSNLEKIKEDLNLLVEQKSENENKKIALDKGRKALKVKGYEDKYIDKRYELKNIASDLLVIQTNKEAFKASYAISLANYKAEQSREADKNNVIRDITENQRLIEKASNYESNKSNVATLEGKVKGIKTRIGRIDDQSQENNKVIELINIELEEIKKAKEGKGKLEIELLNNSNIKEKFDSLHNALGVWKGYNLNHRETKVSFDKLDEKFISAKRSYENIEDIYRRSQAGILAKDLQEGDYCPVCGAIHHPNLAKLENSEISETSIKISKEALEKVRKERDKKIEELTRINSSIRSIKENTIDPYVKELLHKDIILEVSTINAEVTELVNVLNVKLSELKSRIQGESQVINKEKEKIRDIDKLQNSNNELRLELQLKNASLVEDEGKLSSGRNTLEIIKNEFKGQIKTAKELEENIKVLNKNLQAIKIAFEKSEIEFNKAKSLSDQEEGKYESTKKRKQNIEVELNNSIKVFKEKMLEFGFNDPLDYEISCITEPKIKKLDEEINEFQIKLARVTQSYNDSLNEIMGLERTDLTILNEKLKIEKTIKEALDNEAKETFSRIRNNILIEEACVSFNKLIEKDEKAYRIIGKLSNVTNGENSKKISFERYVLATYFEDIIGASNIRFTKMTSGRFELLRKKDIGDKRKGQGLDLEVFDNYTGKARDAKTLSGGESFKASLAMALGLADIVQAHAGGIQLDTMFIDEGFGTLDPESLDNAIECLMDLQNDGRLVGIISHVPELKERITARLEVSATSMGSRAEFKV